MIELRGVCKAYGKHVILENVDLTVSDGAVFGLVGINGAGKSTLLRLISGVLKPERGSILVDGEPVYENEKAKRKLFFLPDDPYYTVNINGDGLAALYKTFYDFDDKIYAEYADKFKLDKKAPIRNFSKGMKRQLFVSLALACKPKYLLLDEAFDGLDPLARLVFKRGIISAVESGSTVIISSHSLRELEDISDSYGLLDERRIASSGDIETAISKLHKFMIVTDEDLQSVIGEECKLIKRTGRVYYVITENDGDALRSKLKDPVCVEEVPMDFEELFESEVANRGYLQ